MHSEQFFGISSTKDQPNVSNKDGEEISLRRISDQQPTSYVQQQLTQNTQSNGQPTCPSCGDYFDSTKKRRLIDNCGHERCYTCMFNKGLCPLCTNGLITQDQGRNTVT